MREGVGVSEKQHAFLGSGLGSLGSIEALRGFPVPPACQSPCVHPAQTTEQGVQHSQRPEITSPSMYYLDELA